MQYIELKEKLSVVQSSFSFNPHIDFLTCIAHKLLEDPYIHESQNLFALKWTCLFILFSMNAL